MQNRLITLITLLLLSLHAFGQEGKIFGVVSDEENNPLPNTYIIIDGNDGAVTDLDGKYSVETESGERTITFRYLGYKEMTVKVDLGEGGDYRLNVALEEDAERLNIVVVTASQYEKNIAEESVSVDVLDREFLQNNNSRDIGEALSHSPGVQVTDGQISIRSGSSWAYGIGSRTAIMQDGVSMLSADLGEAQLKFTPVELVDQVEIVKGASSVVYGSSALNGVVNLRTKWPKKHDRYTDVIPYYGIYARPPREELKWWEGRQPSFQGVFISHYSGGGSFKNEKAQNFSTVLGVNIDNTQSYLQAADEWRMRGNFKTRYMLPRNNKINFELNGNVMKEVSGRFFLSLDLDSNAYRIAQGTDDSYWRTHLNPRFNFRSDKGHSYSTNFGYLNVWRRGNGDDINSSSNAYSMDNQYQYNWKDKIFLTTGLPLNFGFSKSSLYDGLRVTVSGATYTQIEGRIKKLSVVAGVRYEIQQVDTLSESTIPVFRTGLNYSPGKKETHLRASWGQAYRLPSIGERFVSGEIFQGFFVVPNKDLEVETGWSTEFGFKQGIKIKDWKGWFDLATFWNEYKGYVEYVPGIYTNINPDGSQIFPGSGSFIFGLNPQNVDHARIWGFETSIVGTGNLHPAIACSIRVGYTYTYPANLEADTTLKDIGTYFQRAVKNFKVHLDAENPESNSMLFYRSRHIFKTDIEFNFKKKLIVGYGIYYASFAEKIPPLFHVATDFLDGGKGTLLKYVENHQKGDWLHNMRVFYQMKDFIRLGLLVKNVTNHEYSGRPGRLEPPRSWTIQLKISF